MTQLSIFDRIRKRVSMDRLGRIIEQYEAIKLQLAPKGRDVQEVEFFTREFERYAKITQRLANARLLFYGLLYATLLINVLKMIPLLAFLVTFIEFGSAIFGTTILIGLIFVLSARIRLNIELMQDCMMHLVSIYHKNPKRDAVTTLARIQKAI